ncbi:30S ribosomal protein S7 [Candidatus Undinarchaeota archaeon]
MSDIKIFNKWDVSNIQYADAGVKDYISLTAMIAPTTGGKHVRTQFWKAKTPIVERLMNKLMVTGHLKEGRVHKRTSGRDTGKKFTSYKAVKESFDTIAAKTKENPIQILVRALENAAPIAETTAFRQGGIIARKPVDLAPQRRIDLSLRFISHGAGQRCFRKKISLGDALAAELIDASNNDNKAYSVMKKEEYERVAASAR